MVKIQKKAELSGLLASTSDEVMEFLYEEPTTILEDRVTVDTYTRLYNNQTEQN